MNNMTGAVVTDLSDNGLDGTLHDEATWRISPSPLAPLQEDRWNGGLEIDVNLATKVERFAIPLPTSRERLGYDRNEGPYSLDDLVVLVREDPDIVDELVEPFQVEDRDSSIDYHILAEEGPIV